MTPVEVPLITLSAVPQLGTFDRIMAAARWPEKLEGEVDTGQGDPVPVAWLFRCRSSSDCKIIDIQVTGSLSMTESIRGDLSTTAHCAN